MRQNIILLLTLLFLDVQLNVIMYTRFVVTNSFSVRINKAATISHIVPIIDLLPRPAGNRRFCEFSYTSLFFNIFLTIIGLECV